ncbi:MULTISPECIES: HIT family protein [unclassified Achromobacter]|uniref:HIT family protein n=1 Tax=unclassified Achromobacter TaxID=2626865 RepID=UPI000B51D4C3|nr:MULTISPECIES: HIT family protein [unclassified Achromobacter]OWT74893.1 diadenosine tetraphosphate hydrolase [Achromobacter sp. HZ28]OWT76501.1 diadenosine tetraphosphate hydrolase [Achromobacter sp. HZ34]
MTTLQPDCPLCQQPGGALLWRGDHLRVVEVDDADYPGYTRVIWNSHIPEMTSLSRHGRELVMQTVWTVEEVQREIFHPDKINLASLGNMVPHLHWHVIPRWRGDRHFPDAVWAAPRVAPGAESEEWHARMTRLQSLMQRYRNRLLEALGAMSRH